MLKSYLQTINSVSEFFFISLFKMRKTQSVLSPTRDSISTLSFISLYFCCLRPKSVFSKTRLYVWVILYICLVTEENWLSDIYNWDSLSELSFISLGGVPSCSIYCNYFYVLHYRDWTSFKGFRKNLCDKELNKACFFNSILGVSQIFIPKSIKMIRVLSTLYQALINKNIIKMEIRSGRSSEFKVTVNMTENTFALSVLQALLPFGLVLWIKMSATSAKVVN